MGARLLVAALVALGLSAAPASAATDAFAVHYEGSYEWHQDWEGGSAGPTAGSYLRTNETLTWVMDVSGSKAGPDVATDLHVKLSAQGTIEQQGSDPNANEHCTMSQARTPGARATPDRRTQQRRHTQRRPRPCRRASVRDLLVTGNHQNCDEFTGSVLFCETSACAGATVCGEVPPIVATRRSAPRSRPGSIRSKTPQGRSTSQGRARRTPSRARTVGLKRRSRRSPRACASTPAAARPRATRGKHIPTIERQKVFAKGDLLPTIFRAEAACGTVALGHDCAGLGNDRAGRGRRRGDRR